MIWRLVIIILGHAVIIASPMSRADAVKPRQLPATIVTLSTMPWGQTPKWLAALEPRRREWQRHASVGLDCIPTIPNPRHADHIAWVCAGRIDLGKGRRADLTLRFTPTLLGAEVRGKDVCAILEQEFRLLFGDSTARLAGQHGPIQTWRLHGGRGLNVTCNRADARVPFDEAIIDLLGQAEYRSVLRLAERKAHGIPEEAIDVLGLPWGARRAAVEQLPGIVCTVEEGCTALLRFGGLRGRGELGLWDDGRGRALLQAVLLRFPSPLPCIDVLRAVPQDFTLSGQPIMGLYRWKGPRGRVEMLCRADRAEGLKFHPPASIER